MTDNIIQAELQDFLKMFRAAAAVEGERLRRELAARSPINVELAATIIRYRRCGRCGPAG